METRRYWAISLLLLVCCLAQAQQNRQQGVQLFTITTAEFHYEQHAWSDELFVHISGEADRVLDGCVLGVAIWYYGERVRWKLLHIRYDEKKLVQTIPFDEVWGPLNRTPEYVLSGEYWVEVSLPRDHQPAHARDSLDKLLAGRSVKAEKRTLRWGSPESFAREDRYMRKFYGERISRLQQLYQELQQRVTAATDLAVAPKKGKVNPLPASQVQARIDEWRSWLRGTFEKDLAQESQLFQKFHKKIFSRRYPLAKGSMEEYYSSFLRLARLYNLKVYQAYQLTLDRRENKMDATGLERAENIQDNLQRLLRQAMQELKLNPPTVQSGKNK